MSRPVAAGYLAATLPRHGRTVGYLCATHLSVERTTWSVTGSPNAQAIARDMSKIDAIIIFSLAARE